ncbi:Uncharacterized membrane protein YsdA, DUF1294 family [Flavobacterium swingsii]|uniref:Uncharacterized membrane protein YsdA, DUF1294 family n=1 Tax=Flavobacterium swingsii TaxID=498292 RepID=A0A1I0Y544_9FLAO|nr:DUF1294 domain-containing protein [Flavobacterium swingsii]SFB08429.1 Uncharacterized membrane protein YsdA, DUF1294 family [Flavobacterium swingsii]
MTVILIYFFIINIIGFFLIGYDKKMAVANKYRIAEKTLLLIVLLGGVIGSGLAMLFFRHKTSKISYLLKFFGVIVLQILFIFLLKTT